MKISVYGYLFNATKREFDLDGMVKNFTDFADEVVIATIPSEDDTYEHLLGYQSDLGENRFKVVMTDIKLSNNRFDGALKTEALKACSKSLYNSPRVYVIADADERFVPSNKEEWIRSAIYLYNIPVDGLLIPVVDLYKDENHIRSDHDIGFKFRMHKDTVVARGVIPQAEMYDGLFRTDISDSTEPLNSDGELADFYPVITNPIHLSPMLTEFLNKYPYVLHYGHLDVERRVRLNNEFWHQHWKNRSGVEPEMLSNVNQLNNIKLIKHNIPLV